MKTEILSPKQVIDLIQKRIDSNNWWVIVVCSPMSIKIAEAIETKYYNLPQSSADFELFIGSFDQENLIGIYTANKCHMTKKQLIQLFGLNETSGDIIIAPDIPVGVMNWFIKTFRG